MSSAPRSFFTLIVSYSVSNEVIFYDSLFIGVVYEYGAGLYCVFIEWCGDKIKEMFAKTEIGCGFILDTDTNQLPPNNPALVPFSHLYVHFPPRVPKIGVFPCCCSFPFCFSFLTVVHTWSCDYRGATKSWLYFSLLFCLCLIQSHHHLLPFFLCYFLSFLLTTVSFSVFYFYSFLLCMSFVLFFTFIIIFLLFFPPQTHRHICSAMFCP